MEHHYDIEYNDGSHRYILEVDGEHLSVEAISSLINDIEAIAGSCHVERNFLIIFVPTGFYLHVPGDLITRIELAIALNEDLSNV